MLVASPTNPKKSYAWVINRNLSRLHREKENEQDEFATAAYRNEFVVGHMPFYLSKAVVQISHNSKLEVMLQSYLEASK